MGSKVQDRHIFLLTQSILSNGVLCGVNRHGLKKSGNPIAQMCFENGRKVVMRLAMTNAVDNCEDDTSAILLGRKSHGGTGSVQFKPTHTSTKRKLATFQTNHTFTFKELVKRCRIASKQFTKQPKQPVHDTTKNTNTDLQQAVISALINDNGDGDDDEEYNEYNEYDEYDHTTDIDTTNKDKDYQYIPCSPHIYSPSSPHMYSPSSDNFNIQDLYNKQHSSNSPTIQPYSPSSPCLSYLPNSPYTPLSPTY